MLPAWVDQYIGIPYVAGGRSRKGADCYGLVWLVLMEQFGVKAPEYLPSDGYPVGDKAHEAFGLACNSAEWGERRDAGRFGDVVLFHGRRQLVSHCGLVVGDGYFLHSEHGMNAALGRIRGARWIHLIHGYYRHRSLRTGQAAGL